MLNPQTTLNCRGQLVDLSRPQVMGILNVTPDSFYDGGRFHQQDSILEHVEQMLTAGATFIDIGGMSSRPGAAIIDSELELQRVLPAVELIRTNFPQALLSIDTIYANVAKACLDAGAHMINDISAGRVDEAMWPIVVDFQVPYIMMHMQGLPNTMQQQPTYGNVSLEVLDFFIPRIRQLVKLGLHDILIDVGFGFGKSVEHNYQLLKSLHTFSILEKPVLVGISRKSMICKILKVNPKDALNGTTALHMIALQQGAKILRVHDVQEAMECIALHEQLALTTVE